MQKMKKLFCLCLVVAMTTTLLSACGKSEKKTYSLTEMSKEEMTLTYSFWQDMEIVEQLVEEFEKKYPNITVNTVEFGTATNNTELLARSAAKTLPDCFWIVDGCDFAIENGLLFEMTPLWENDPDTKNLIPGIEEFRLGYFGTDYKWVTPVKYFPSTAFVNKQLFSNENVTMPDKDWTWEEYEKVISDMSYQNTDGKQLFGISEQVTAITWYPVASDYDCIGEFGWDGKSFDLTNWAYGANLEAKMNKENWKAPTDPEKLVALYGVDTAAQDLGYVAMRIDLWWCWEDYWSTDSYIENNVIYVPYVMPHTENNPDGNYMAIMDFGGLSAITDHPREAYELLKFMTWGAEGWKIKAEIYPETYDQEAGRYISKQNMPICLDEEVWDVFKSWHPGADDSFGRGEYFDYFFDKAMNAKWTCWGGHQIPGFTTWLTEVYTDTMAAEDKVLNQGQDAYDLVEDLTRTANESNAKRLEEIEEILM